MRLGQPSNWGAAGVGRGPQADLRGKHRATEGPQHGHSPYRSGRSDSWTHWTNGETKTGRAARGPRIHPRAGTSLTHPLHPDSTPTSAWETETEKGLSPGKGQGQGQLTGGQAHCTHDSHGGPAGCRKGLRQEIGVTSKRQREGPREEVAEGAGRKPSMREVPEMAWGLREGRQRRRVPSGTRTRPAPWEGWGSEVCKERGR